MLTEPQKSTKQAVSPLRSSQFVTMFIVLCVLFSLGQFHRSAGAVLSPVFVEEFVLSAAQVGLVIGGMFIVQGLLQVPSGVLLDRYGTRRVLPTMALAAVVGCFLIGLAESWFLVLIGRALLGVGFATSMLGSYSVFVRWTTPELIGTVTGRFLFFGGTGALLATFPLAWLIEVFDWRSVFLVLGGITLVATIFTFVVVRDSPDDDVPDVAAPQKTLIGSVLGLWVVLKDRRIWPALMIAPFLYSPLQVLIGLWAGPFFKDVHQIGAIDRSYILLMMVLGSNFGMLFYGPIERFFNTRRNVILAATGLISAGFLSVALFGYSSVWLSATLFLVITVVAPFFVVVLVHSQVMFPPEYANRVVSLVNLFSISGVFLNQYLTGSLIDAVTDDPTVTGSVAGYRLVFAYMAAVYLAITLVYSRTRDIPPRSAK
ncbi:MFS transporter [Oceanibacterium hippocampi]|uniref:Putative sulfoacetate transporter SauU n=1 Tax=Oceanibacterium hippocampi TaxID=745714 RepID=A0A1Y5TMG2_9PROT|nr:MFS transporter [Oceanibacterium hippocampi]SLN63793.1 putative sulfoacetate transporter SauU [Oceanibacterium hippocampi]